MKKTLMSLAALMMLMTAPVMTSCSNDLDETVPAEEQGNVVTLTIAPPTAEAETRVAMNNQLQITGWEVGDKVNLYRVNWNEDVIYSGDVEFICIDASTGTFSGTLPFDMDLDNYNLAVYGATASVIDDTNITLTPSTYSSDKLKDVVVMVAKKSGEGTYQMKIANNVLKVTNTGSDVEVAWTGKDISGTDVDFFKPLITYTSDRWKGYDLEDLPDDCKGWDNVPHFTLAGSNKVTYLTMSQASYNSQYNSIEYWGLAKQDGTEVLAKKSMTGKGYDYKTGTGVTGKVWTVTVGAGPKLNIKVTSSDIATLKAIKVVTDKNIDGESKEKVLQVAEAQQTPSAEGTVYSVEIPSQTYEYYKIYLSADGTTYKEAMASKSNVGEITEDKAIDYEKNAVQLWENGPYFATMNVGETTETGNSANYQWGSPLYSGTTYENGQIPATYDVATVNWGSAWRMPTSVEFSSLISSSNCNASYSDTPSPGYTFQSIAYSTNSIFLPAQYSFGAGSYWSATPNGSGPYYLYYKGTSDGPRLTNTDPDSSILVRAVLR